MSNEVEGQGSNAMLIFFWFVCCIRTWKERWLGRNHSKRLRLKELVNLGEETMGMAGLSTINGGDAVVGLLHPIDDLVQAMNLIVAGSYHA